MAKRNVLIAATLVVMVVVGMAAWTIQSYDARNVLEVENQGWQEKYNVSQAEKIDLQAKNEYLQAKNEELQAKNEELQTKNEELISVWISKEEFLEIFPEQRVKGLKIGDKRLLNESCNRYNIKNENWTNEWYWDSYNEERKEWEKAIVYQERQSDDLIFKIRVAYDGEDGNGMRKDEITNVVFSWNGEKYKSIPLCVVKNMLKGFKY